MILFVSIVYMCLFLLYICVCFYCIYVFVSIVYMCLFLLYIYVFVSFLGGLRVTKPTIRLACPSVCPSVRLFVCPSVCLSVNILLVNTITLQILIALGPNLYHGCISRVSWLSSKMDDLDLFLRSRGVNLNMKIGNFRL